MYVNDNKENYLFQVVYQKTNFIRRMSLNLTKTPEKLAAIGCLYC